MSFGENGEVIDIGARLDAGDSMRAAEAMRKAGCALLVVKV
jgi:hypothetical protein